MRFLQLAASVVAFASSVMAAETTYWQGNSDVKMLPVSVMRYHEVVAERTACPNVCAFRI